MPLPEAAKVAAQFNDRAKNLEAAAARQLVDAYGPIWLRLRSDVISLVNEAQDRQLSAAQLSRLGRYQTLLGQVDREMAIYAATANSTTTAAQSAATALAQEGAQRTVGAALPNGLNFSILDDIGIGWNHLPTGAFQNFIGISGDGAPLARLLAPLGELAKDGVIKGIADGIARGLGPRETAALIRDRFGLPLSRSLLITRTETLRAYREANRMQYQANSNVVNGYQRHSARDSRVCMACIALDGTLYSLDEPLNEHPGGRCALIPKTITYRDLGLDVDEATFEMESAQDWFLNQPESVQRTMMGPGKYKAWQANEFEFKDMAKIQSNSTWGASAVETPLKELVSASSN